MKEGEGLYQQLLARHAKDTSVATAQIDIVCGCTAKGESISIVKLISRSPSWMQDIRRTFPDNSLFDSMDGLSKLRNVLVAYSWKNTRVRTIFLTVPMSKLSDTRITCRLGIVNR